MGEMTLADLNVRNKEFWAQQKKLRNAGLANAAIRETAFEAISSELTPSMYLNSKVETPQQHVAAHPITLELTRCGVTAEQLETMRFKGSGRGKPFNQWTLTWGAGVPLHAIPHIHGYCTLKWLILEDPPYSQDKEAAWRYLNDIIITPVVALGLKHKEAQRQRARRSRGKVTDDGRTLTQILEALALKPEHREETASGLWTHFYAELDQLGLYPKEVGHSTRRKIRYEYCFGDRPGKIAYGQFANLVSKIRKRASA